MILGLIIFALGFATGVVSLALIVKYKYKELMSSSLMPKNLEAEIKELMEE